ncbi:hypothetical protein KSP40_PGU007143 [Platanthera guangdongensis]|uniref:Uncharacterized protein n=1 Tax=Platanthera guangdongensis TaxID=2320717 RepID=A0ABR2LXT0_9ASPA
MVEEYGQIGRRAAYLRRPVHTWSPLAPEILTHPIPTGFKLPNIESYDGTDELETQWLK